MSRWSRRPRRTAAAAAGLVLLLVLAGTVPSCSGPPEPQDWAPREPAHPCDILVPLGIACVKVV